MITEQQLINAGFTKQGERFLIVLSKGSIVAEIREKNTEVNFGMEGGSGVNMVVDRIEQLEALKIRLSE